jgi:metal-responsive CopG/Arc/MetJ family transcriptional regulator
MENNKKGGNSSTRAKNKYNAKAYDMIHVVFPKGRRDEIDYIVKELGYNSRNEFIVSAIEEKINREYSK